jgi:hypothetical protein
MQVVCGKPEVALRPAAAESAGTSPAIRFPAHEPTCGKESKMDNRTAPSARRGREEERREVEFYVRAKTGPGKRDWTTIGVALKRRNDEPGFSIKLNTLPISKDWDGGLVLVPPYQESSCSPSSR